MQKCLFPHILLSQINKNESLVPTQIVVYIILFMMDEQQIKCFKIAKKRYF